MFKRVKRNHEQSRTPLIRSPDIGKKGVELIINSGCNSIDTLLEYVEQDNKEPLVAVKGLGEKTVNALFNA